MNTRSRYRYRGVARWLVVALVTPLALVAWPAAAGARNHTGAIDVWLTDIASGIHLEQQDELRWRHGTAARGPRPGRPPVITIDERRDYQRMAGFGASLTDSSAWLIANRLDADQRQALLRDLFDPADGIGLSFLRQPMGATDFTATGNYSYDDTCCNLADFSVAHDEEYIIPLLRQAIALNPQLQLMATPWSPPGWMKTSGSMIGGTLLPDANRPLAEYFALFLEAYAAHGITVDYVTPNNEPLHLPGTYPGMSLSTDQAAEFITGHLGPVLRDRGLDTRILGYDHNWDVTSYPESFYADPATRPHVAGTAWHCYAGSVPAQSISHNNYPGKAAFLTECSGGDWEGDDAARFRGAMHMVVNAPRHWAESVVRWNLALDEDHGPTNRGCDVCRAIVTIVQDGDGWSYVKDVEYYALGHASAFVRPGAARIASSLIAGVDGGIDNGIDNVAFANSDGGKVLVAHNTGDKATTFRVQWGNRWFEHRLEPGAAATYTWDGRQRGRAHKDAIGSVDVTFDGPGGTDPMVSYHAELAAHHDRVRVGDRWYGYTLPTGASLEPAAAGTALDRSGWTVSAAASAGGDPPVNAIDGDPGTRWSTGRGMQPGDWFQVDFGAPTAVSQVVVDAGGSNDFLRGYEIYVSADGHDWGDPIATGPGRPLLRVLRPAVTARYLRVVNTGSAGNWWSVHELEVLAPGAGPTGGAGATATGLQRQHGRLPDGTRVEAIYNPTGAAVGFEIRLGRDQFHYRLPATAAAIVTVHKVRSDR